MSHGNFVSVISSTAFIDKLQLREDDVHLSYLPMAHIFEKMNIVNIIYSGAEIGFYSGDVQKLKDDLRDLRPTIFASVPRLYNRMYDAMMDKIKSLKGFASTLA